MNEKMILVEQDKIDMILQMLESLKQAVQSNSGLMDLKHYDSKEAASMLGVSQSTIKNLRREGRIGFIQDRKVVRFTYDQLKNYSEANIRRTFKKNSNGSI